MEKKTESLRQYIKQLGYVSVLHKMAIISIEGNRPSIHSAIFKMSYDKKVKPLQRSYSFGGLDIFEAQYTIKEFDKILEKLEQSEYSYLDRLGLSQELNRSLDLPEELQWKYDGLKINLVFGNLVTDRLFGSKDDFCHVKRDNHTPLWLFELHMNNNYVTHSWPETDFTKSRPPYENPQDCINDQMGFDFFTTNNSPFFAIVLPITKARIESCETEDELIKIKLFFEKDYQSNSLYLNIIYERGKERERVTEDIKKKQNYFEIHTKFIPEKITVHLFDGDLKLDSSRIGEVKTTFADLGVSTGISTKQQGADFSKSRSVFISHAMEDYELAKEIKEILVMFGLEVFVAHQDIEPSKKWEDEIYDRLRTSPIFIPIFTKAFSKSEWTDQESGIALASNSEILPVIVDVDPYGFIEKFQGLRWGHNFYEDVSRLVSRVLDHLPTEQKAAIRKEIIEGFGSYEKCRTYDISGVFARVISSFPSLTANEIELLAAGTIKNNQIHDSRNANSVLRPLFNKYKSKLPKKYLKDETIARYFS